MNLLITGAFKGNDSFYQELRSLGYELFFFQDEKSSLEDFGIDPSLIDGVICNALFLYTDIKDFKSLKFIQLTSAGLDRIPLEYIKEHGIKLFNARGVYSIPMSEYAIAGVLQLYKKSYLFKTFQTEHKWEKQRDIIELYGKTICIVGCGSVGTECAKRFKAFGCKILGLDVSAFDNAEFDKIYPIERANDVFRKSDIVVLTLPLTDKTVHFINRDELSFMKSGAILVNISRGKVVNEYDLIQALQNNLGGAVLDVFEEEPLNKKSPLWDMPNVIITPHNSFIGDGNEKRLRSSIIKNIIEITPNKDRGNR